MRRLEKILFYLLVFCLPFQTRIILFSWGDVFNEWNSAFFYFTDFLIIALFILWFWRLSFEKEIIIKFSVLGIFLLVALISLRQAGNLELGFYWWLKLLEFVLLFVYLKQNFKELFSPKRLAQVFIVSALFQSLIAIFQFIKQQSLGLKYLGESVLGPDIAGVAKFIVDGKIVVRAYGTLPHANVLAVFLLLAIFCLYYLYLSRQNYSVAWNLFFGLLYAELFLGLWFTFSRVVIFAFLASSILYFIFLYKKYQPQMKFLILIFLLLFFIFVYFTWPQVAARLAVSSDEQAVSLRLHYNQIAFSIIQKHPWLGTGLGNFVWQSSQLLPGFEAWLYQPVHNIYLLAAAETGLIGLVLFLYFLFRQIYWRIKKNNLFSKTFCFLFLSFLLIGFFDHFFWTLQQGQLIWWLVLGILASRTV